MIKTFKVLVEFEIEAPSYDDAIQNTVKWNERVQDEFGHDENPILPDGLRNITVVKD